MASKEQYEYFKDRFADELERKNALMRKTQIYFSVISVLISILFTNIYKKDDLPIVDGSFRLTLLILFCLLFIVLVFLICSIRLQNYSTAININKYLDELPQTEKEQTNSDFFDNRIADFIAAIELNHKTNNKKADLLKLSEYGLFGFLFMLLIITLQIII